MQTGSVLLGIAKVCKCGHAASYHQIKNKRNKKGKYLNVYYVECLVDICDCEKFNHVDTVKISFRLGEFGGDNPNL